MYRFGRLVSVIFALFVLISTSGMLTEAAGFESKDLPLSTEPAYNISYDNWKNVFNKQFTSWEDATTDNMPSDKTVAKKLTDAITYDGNNYDFYVAATSSGAFVNANGGGNGSPCISNGYSIAMWFEDKAGKVKLLRDVVVGNFGSQQVWPWALYAPDGTIYTNDPNVTKTTDYSLYGYHLSQAGYFIAVYPDERGYYYGQMLNGDYDELTAGRLDTNRARLYIKKVDDNAVPAKVEGAGLDLTGKTSKGDNYKNSWTSGSEDFNVHLEAGEYTLSETSVPDGYEKADDISIRVDNNGDAYVDGGTTPVTEIAMVDKIKKPGNVNTPTPVTVDPPIRKIVVGNPPKTESFTFRMKAVSNTAGYDVAEMPMPDGSVNGEKVKTVEGAGDYEFGEFALTTEGTYVYSVTEDNGSAEGFSYDGSRYTITWIVADKGGTLSAERLIENQDGETFESCLFTNSYEAPQVTIDKPKDPNDPDDGSSTITPIDSNNPDDGSSTITPIDSNNPDDSSATIAPVDPEGTYGPADPNNPEESSTTTQASRGVKTGDEAAAWIWLLLLVAATVLVTVISIRRQRA